jgi:hypothetical protein
VRNDGQPLVQFVTSVAGINGLSEPVQVQVIISRTTGLELAASRDKAIGNDSVLRGIGSEVTATHEKVTSPKYEGGPTPYIHSVTTNLSEANKQGLDNLAYWRNGPEASKVYIHNQALAQYLAQYKESQRPIPFKDARQTN